VRGDGALEVVAGFATALGPRNDNQDFAFFDPGSAQDRAVQGVIAAMADGVGGASGGRTAAELAVRAFLEGYRAQDPLAGVGVSAYRVMDAFNSWLYAQARVDPKLTGACTTFTGLIVRSREATFLHAGDTRAWHLRGDDLTQVTRDHIAFSANGRQTLLRAVGLEERLRLEVQTVALERHDRILLTSDGVHSILGHHQLRAALRERSSPQAGAETIIAAAIAAGLTDNATVLLLDIVSLPAVDWSAVEAELKDLSILAPPEPGALVDGFSLDRILVDSQFTRVMLARENNGTLVVLKFPKASMQSDRTARSAFLRETFLGRRVSSPFVGGALQMADGRQSRLYLAMPLHRGMTLEARLTSGPLPVNEAIRIAVMVGQGLKALHRLGITHRDVKPENVVLTDDGGLKLIDFGAARILRVDTDDEDVETPGTASFMAPELFGSHRGDAASDQFALGVTLYRMLTGDYPYGEAEPGRRPLFGPPVSAWRRRPEIPAWLDATVMRAIALRPNDRFADVDELIYELEAGRAPSSPWRRALPLAERNPVLLWKLISVLLFAGLIIALLSR
jgi:serine/threonine protein phosphatase PrpC